MITRYNTRRDAYSSVFAHGAHGAELGVLRGVNAYDLWHACRPRRLDLVDNLSSPFADPEVMKRMVPEAKIICESAYHYLKRMGPDSLDWIYLDTSHNYDDTVDELDAAWIAVRPNGIIGVHDFCFGAWAGGVVLPVIDAIASQKVTAIAATVLEQFPSLFLSVNKG